MKYPKWYDCIEEPVRDIVYILRNNGFNTTCSCGHKMYVEMNLQHNRLEDLWSLLTEEWGEFYIEFYWEGCDLYRSWAIVTLGNRKP